MPDANDLKHYLDIVSDAESPLGLMLTKRPPMGDLD